jgi:endogenous inhibitor of DNA gyrase (YacG/DUF329 family)
MARRKKERKRVKCPHCGTATRRAYTQDTANDKRSFVAGKVRVCPKCETTVIDGKEVSA